MTPVRIEFTVKNNEAWQDGFLLAFKGGAAFDFADYRPLRMQVKRPGYQKPLLDLTEDNGGLVVDVDGGLGINVAEADIAYLLGTYDHDIRGLEGGDPVVICDGTVTVQQGVTYTWP